MPRGPVVLGENIPPADPSAVSGGTPPAPNGFSIFWITDTQFLSESNPALFQAMNNWIVSQWGAYNGKLVIHTGDVVQTGNVEQEWVNAGGAMAIFVENKIPYTWCAGNHDNWVIGDQNTAWIGNSWGAPALDPYAARKFVNSLPYTRWVDDYHLGMNTALTFVSNGLKFLVISLEWNANPDVLLWAERILDHPAYSDCQVIVAPHAYIDAYGSINDPRWGSTIGDFISGLVPLLDSHPNVFLTLNGHFATESGYNTPVPINGRNELMFDRQDCCDLPGDPTGRGIDDTAPGTDDSAKVGGATVTILNFDIDNNQIHVSTYDVYTGQWMTDTENQYAVTMFESPPAIVTQPVYGNLDRRASA